jgi:F-type H+-transporting ATPase subunit alpha
MLAKGERLTEILKQDQYSPLPMEKQVTILYAATQGYLDRYAVSEARRYESELYKFMDLRHPELLRELAEKKDVAPIADRLRAALDEFAEVFQSSSAAA